MANHRISMEIVEQIKLLHQAGIGTKSIARQLQISKNTVKDYLRKGKKEDELEKENTSKEALYAFFPYCKKELKRKGVTRQLLWGEYKTQHPDGYMYSQFCEHFNRWLSKQNVSLHIEQLPADRMYVDYTGKKLEIVDRDTGEIIPVEVFVSVLGYSGYTYVEASMSQQKEDFLMSISRAFQYYQGVPKVLIPDNLKSAVTGPDKYEADINKDLFDLGNHYGIAIMPARSRKPQDKAWVEKMVCVVYTRIFAPLRNTVFTSLQDLNEAIWELLDVHNKKALQRRQESRITLFDKHEKALLKPLPDEIYELKKYKCVKVMKTSHIQLSDDKHYYSVPYQYIGQKARIVYSATRVSIYVDKQRVAYHLRDRRPHKYTTKKDHLPSTHKFVSEWNPEKFTTWAAKIDPGVKEYILKVLNNNSYPEQTYRSCVGILSYEKKVGKERLIAACKRAGEFGSYNYTTIKRIIDKKLDKLPKEPEIWDMPKHQNVRGSEYYK